MYKWNFYDFGGELRGDVPVIVEIKNGEVQKLIVPKGEEFSVGGIHYVDFDDTAQEILDSGMAEEWEITAYTMLKKLKDISEGGDFELEEEILEDFQKQINEEKLITTDSVGLDGEVYEWVRQPRKFKGKINPLKFTGQLLSYAEVDVECYIGGVVQSALILTENELSPPDKFRLSEKDPWEPMGEEESTDFGNLINGQPLARWNVGGYEETVGDIEEIEERWREELNKDIQL